LHDRRGLVFDQNAVGATSTTW